MGDLGLGQDGRPVESQVSNNTMGVAHKPISAARIANPPRYGWNFPENTVDWLRNAISLLLLGFALQW